MPLRKKPTTSKPLKFLMLGVGDFFPRRYYYTSFLILTNHSNVLVDCPDPLHKVLFEATRRSGISIEITDINNVILTHLHGDHSNGLEGLGFYKHFIHKRRPTIYTIAEVANNLWEHKLCGSMCRMNDLESMTPRFYQLQDFFKIRLLREGVIHRIKDLKVIIRMTKHYIPCFGLKIGYKGRWLGYSSDTAFDPEHISFLSDCHLILHETNVGGHTPYEKLLTLPESIRNKMLLVHLTDDFDTRRSKIPCAEEGKIYYV